jgi:sulfoxide reductase catalytic subunit YedY
LAGAAAAAGVGLSERPSAPAVTEGNPAIDGIQKSKFSTSEAITPYKDVTNYNNYYEFSTDKYGPARLAQDFRIRPWTLSIEGLLKKKQVLDVDSIIKLAAPEERIYRHRCVEGWSIVVPWIGFPLSVLINRVEPDPKAKFVKFISPLPVTRFELLSWRLLRGKRRCEDSCSQSVRRI